VNSVTGDDKRPATNMRRIRQDSDRSFLLLAIATLIIVGGLLIGLIFGPETLLTALPCLVGGAALILAPWLLLSMLEKWRNKAEYHEEER
jgi:hypothetical protein